jgi:ribosomal protein S18 acetylase RimI-like enzyme
MTECTPSSFRLEDVFVRTASDADHDAIRLLFNQGAVEGHVRDNDTGADVENLHEAYFSDDGASGFWVACCGSTVIGMIGVQKTREDTAEVRRLRVHEEYRRHGIGTLLMEVATRFCREHGYLKVVLDVRTERGPAIALFDKFGFQLSRTREIENHRTLDFFFNLYSTDPE